MVIHVTRTDLVTRIGTTALISFDAAQVRAELAKSVRERTDMRLSFMVAFVDLLDWSWVFLICSAGHGLENAGRSASHLRCLGLLIDEEERGKQHLRGMLHPVVDVHDQFLVDMLAWAATCRSCVLRSRNPGVGRLLTAGCPGEHVDLHDLCWLPSWLGPPEEEAVCAAHAVLPLRGC